MGWISAIGSVFSAISGFIGWKRESAHRQAGRDAAVREGQEDLIENVEEAGEVGQRVDRDSGERDRLLGKYREKD